LWAKDAQNVSVKFGEIQAKILRTPEHLPTPTPMPRTTTVQLLPLL